MKNLFKTKQLSFLSFLLMNVAVQAQQLDLETPVRNITDQIKSIFPLIAGGIFLIVVLVNLGHFVKEGGDWKKGLLNIIIYTVIFGAVAGLFTYIISVQL